MTHRDDLQRFGAKRAVESADSDEVSKPLAAPQSPILFLAALAVWLLSAYPNALPAQESAAGSQPTLVIPLIDVERGRQLFVNKGCVICHSINGVGGQAAAALDAPPGQRSIDILDFVARMFLGASAMLDLQATELGYQIALQPQEIGDLAAFVYDSRTQADFSYAEVPVPLQDWILNEPYWEFEEWPDDLPEIYPEMQDGSKR
ncbi:MAG TPA: c-type cytochrome [Kiloniellaceae bacterium]|nr:c-type cytochrome [Kiloniellaceae bacterium]